ncbi:substrate-binding and VWA domain-containing protein [Actinomadura sediminis]|uniref:Substrate-binding and VWA domain-containing protein n=1 Tax=Actinomadura sediminis TaxID=1038904 RepID=A0ABW3EJD1_9ACTN
MRQALVVAGAALAVAAGTAVYAVSAGGGCGGSAVGLDVAVAPELVPAVTRAADDFNGRERRVGGRCVRVAVRAAGPAGVAALLSGRIPPDAGVRRPDVWVPDSSLWLRTLDDPPETVGGPVARSPLVAAVPRRRAGDVTAPTWDGVLQASMPGPGDARSTRLTLADPARTGAGLTALLLVHARLHKAEASFATFARAAQENMAPDARGVFEYLAGGGESVLPVLLAPEQSVWAYNRTGPEAPAEAVYPREGTLSLDYPFVLVDPERDEAARLFEGALRTPEARDALRALGFRDTGGAPPPDFRSTAGVRAQRPAELAAPTPQEVRDVVQAWARLALGSRMLSLIDVSGSMAAKVPGTDLTRLQAIAQAAQQGLTLQPDGTELGQWIFSTRMDGRRDWRETVPIGPLGERIGSATRRQRILGTLTALRPKPDGDTGLYDTLLAAMEFMRRTYKPEMINTVLVYTDGRNDDPDGPSLDETIDRLRDGNDPRRPVQIVVVGFGPEVDTDELERLADATRGSVYTAHRPSDVLRIFGEAMARRLCAPDC